jgi:hypothetical protein
VVVIALCGRAGCDPEAHVERHVAGPGSAAGEPGARRDAGDVPAAGRGDAVVDVFLRGGLHRGAGGIVRERERAAYGHVAQGVDEAVELRRLVRARGVEAEVAARRAHTTTSVGIASPVDAVRSARG